MESGAHLRVPLLCQPDCPPIAQMPGYFTASVAPRGGSDFQSKLPVSLSSTPDTRQLQQLHLDAVNVKCQKMAGCPSRKESHRWPDRSWDAQARRSSIPEQTPHLSAAASITAKCLPFSSMPAASFQSSRSGEVPAPTSWCLISALKKVSSNSLKKPVEHLKVKRGWPLSLPNSLIVDYHSSLASRTSADLVQCQSRGRHSFILHALETETHPRLTPEVHPSIYSSLKSCNVN